MQDGRKKDFWKQRGIDATNRRFDGQVLVDVWGRKV